MHPTQHRRITQDRWFSCLTLFSSIHGSRLIPGVQSLTVGASFLFSGLHSRSRSFSFSFYIISTFLLLFFVHRFVIPHCPCFGRIVMGSGLRFWAGPGGCFVSFRSVSNFNFNFNFSAFCVPCIKSALRYICTLCKRWGGNSNEWQGGDIVLCKYYRCLFLSSV